MRRTLIIGTLLIGGVALTNSSLFAPPMTGEVKILAHRGVHQQFSREGLANDTCTASRMTPPTHEFLENTLPSIAAAFDYGADMVEIDIHPTTDGEFAVFHDWTLDCRTEAKGVTRAQSMSFLKSLDVGYGYTADGGATYPFRGKGVGLTPTLGEVLDAFPTGAFLVNIKSNDPAEARLLKEYFSRRTPHGGELALFASPIVAAAWREFDGGAKVGVKREVKDCAAGYLATGWTGHIPKTCEEFGIVVPQDLAWLYWGWPNRLIARANAKDVKMLVAPALSAPTDGVDTIEQAADLPRNFSGWVLTNRIEVIGPALKDQLSD